MSDIHYTILILRSAGSSFTLIDSFYLPLLSGSVIGIYFSKWCKDLRNCSGVDHGVHPSSVRSRSFKRASSANPAALSIGIIKGFFTTLVNSCGPLFRSLLAGLRCGRRWRRRRRASSRGPHGCRPRSASMPGRVQPPSCPRIRV